MNKKVVRDSNLKSFIILFMGQTISQLGSSMTSFATIIWVYTQTGQVLATSILTVCSTVPYLLVSLFGGAIVDKGSKKKIMLICDFIAALGTVLILVCVSLNCLYLWVLCFINIISGFMNAFQEPASQVVISLMISEKNYARVDSIQSFVNSIVGILKPILAAALLGIGGLKIVLIIDLITFIFAFTTLLFFVKIPETKKSEKSTSIMELLESVKEGLYFLKKENGLLLMLVAYSVLNFMGAISFDSMYSPLILARTGNSEMMVGVVSSAMAAGCMAASVAIALWKQPKKKVPIMFVGSTMCLLGITFFGMGRNIYWWCGVAFLGCFGVPIYHTYQNVLLRNRVPMSMQGRVFALQGMIREMLTPIGYVLGAILADYVFEPFMLKDGMIQGVLSKIVGRGNGAGMGIMFVIAGSIGIIMTLFICTNKKIKDLDIEQNQ